jgi:putative transcriptional regulator
MSEQVTNNIRELRFQNDRMTQQALAEIAGVSRQTIISIESQRYTPSLLLAMKIAKAFSRSVEEVFSCADGAG